MLDRWSNKHIICVDLYLLMELKVLRITLQISKSSHAYNTEKSCKHL